MYSLVAQLVEHLKLNQEVPGSLPGWGIMIFFSSQGKPDCQSHLLSLRQSFTHPKMIENVATYMTYDIHWRCHSAMPCTHMGQTSKILSNLDFFQRLFDLGHQNLPFGCCYEKINNKKKQDISHTVCGDGPRGRHSSMRAHFRLSQRIPSQ